MFDNIFGQHIFVFCYRSNTTPNYYTILVHNAPEHYKKLGFEDCTPDFLDAINGECARFAQERLAPLYSSGDAEGCKYMPNTDVRTPKGYKEAYEEFSEGGWNGLTVPEEYGGQVRGRATTSDNELYSYLQH